MVVTTIRRQAVRASTWKPMSTVSWPAGIQVHSVTSRPSSPNGCACWSAGAMTASAITHTTMTAPTGTISAAQRPKLAWSRRPNSAVNAKPRIGISDDERDRASRRCPDHAPATGSVAARTAPGRKCIGAGPYCRIASYSSTSGVFRLR